MAPRWVVSHVQMEPPLAARQAGRRRAETSLDLGLTTVDVELSPDGVLLPDGRCLPWETVERIARAETKCFAVADDEVREIKVFSEETNRLYSLYPTAGPPTMLISGFVMHRIKGTDPRRDTLEKVRSVAPIAGRVLDTATGLGYTAIEATRTAQEVVTIELDPAALEVARLSPWSQALFDNPKITQLIGDSYDIVPELEPASFARIIHDPPAFSLAGDLYSATFYRELYRVLQPGGRLFHYIGDPESKSGRTTTRGVIKRLQEAGFSRPVLRPQAFGVVAVRQ